MQTTAGVEKQIKICMYWSYDLCAGLQKKEEQIRNGIEDKMNWPVYCQKSLYFLSAN